MAGSPVRPLPACAGAGGSVGPGMANEVSNEKDPRWQGKTAVPPPESRQQRLRRWRAEKDELKTALRESQKRVKELEAAKELALEVQEQASSQASSSPSAFFSRSASLLLSRDSFACASVEDLLRWRQLRQVLNIHQEALESEQSVWEAYVKQQEDERSNLQNGLAEEDARHKENEARMQHLLELACALHGSSPDEMSEEQRLNDESPASADQELMRPESHRVQQVYDALDEDLVQAQSHIRQHIAAWNTFLEAERSENCRRALQLSDQQRRTKRLHDALCQLQGELFRPRHGLLRAKTLPRAASEDPTPSRGTRATAAGELPEADNGQAPTINGLHSVHDKASSSTAPPPVGVFHVPDFIEHVPNSGPPPARARSKSRTPPPPGAAREGPLEDRLQDPGYSTFETPTSCNGYHAAASGNNGASLARAGKSLTPQAPLGPTGERSATPRTPQAPSGERIRALENLLRDVLEELSFEHIVVRQSHGYYKFGELAKAHLHMEGKKLLASADGLDYELFEDFISKLQEQELRSSAMSREDPTGSTSASEAMCGMMMDPSWTKGSVLLRASAPSRLSGDSVTGDPAEPSSSPAAGAGSRSARGMRTGVRQGASNADRPWRAQGAGGGLSTSSSSSSRQAAASRGRSPRAKQRSSSARREQESSSPTPSPLVPRRGNATQQRNSSFTGGSSASTPRTGTGRLKIDKKGSASSGIGDSLSQRSPSGEQLSPPRSAGACSAPLSRASSNAGSSIMAAPLAGGGSVTVLSAVSMNCHCGGSSASTAPATQVTHSPQKPPAGIAGCPSAVHGGSGCFSPPQACFSPPRASMSFEARTPQDVRARTPQTVRALTPRAATPQPMLARGPVSVCMLPSRPLVAQAGSFVGQPTRVIAPPSHSREGLTSGYSSAAQNEPRRWVSPPPGVSISQSSAPMSYGVQSASIAAGTAVSAGSPVMVSRTASASPARPAPPPAMAIAMGTRR